MKRGYFFHMILYQEIIKSSLKKRDCNLKKYDEAKNKFESKIILQVTIKFFKNKISRDFEILKNLIV
jgi:hypothetical protein